MKRLNLQAQATSDDEFAIVFRRRKSWTVILRDGFPLARVILTPPLRSGIEGLSERAVRLPGHVLDALPTATRLPRTASAAVEPLTLTIMLNWSDQAGFEDFGKAFEDPSSPSYRKTISAEELTARFGPSQAAYDSVLDYLQKNGLTLVEGSANRLTLTVRGTRAQAEHTFNVRIDDYELGTRQFHANNSDPALPETLSPLIRSVSGFSNLAQPRAANGPSPATDADAAGVGCCATVEEHPLLCAACRDRLVEAEQYVAAIRAAEAARPGKRYRSQRRTHFGKRRAPCTGRTNDQESAIPSVMIPVSLHVGHRQVPPQFGHFVLVGIERHIPASPRSTADSRHFRHNHGNDRH